MKSISTIFKESGSLIKENLHNVLISSILFNLACNLLAYCCGGIAVVLIVLPITFGFTVAFLQFVRNNQPIEVAQVTAPLKAKNYWGILTTYGWSALYIALWSLLFIIPGIYKALTYSLAPYIVAENPEITGKEALKKSEEMMKGHIGKLLAIWGIFILAIYLIFFVLLWIVGIDIVVSALFCWLPAVPYVLNMGLAILASGLCLLVTPFYFIVMAKFYDEVKGAYEAAK